MIGSKSPDECETAMASATPSEAGTPLTDAGAKTYNQVLKSSALIGGSTMATVALGIVRMKAMAILLGPAGIGLLSLYGSITDLTRSLAGMGVSYSGVRQIAEAVGSGDERRIARTVATLRAVALCSGAVGALLLLIFNKQIARLTFGDERRAMSVALLALVVFFGDISAAQGALVQGMRRIADLARMSVLGSLFGTLFSVPIVYIYGERGLVPSLVCGAAMSIVTSWWYARRIEVQRTHLTLRDILGESSALLKLGVVFMVTGFMTMGSAYLVRILVLRKIGVDAAGYYQAAWALGGLYVGVILQAMGADFYPRLTAVANNHPVCNRMVNEQAEVGILLAVPGVMATLVFAPLVIEMFYSAKFGPAVGILRWICLGMLLRVSSWPMGFIVLAKGEGRIFFWAELVSNLFLVGLVWLCMMRFGLNGTGIGFFGLYVAYMVLIYAIVRRLSGFRWSAENRWLAIVFAPLITAVFASPYFFPRMVAVTVGVLITLGSSLYALKKLCVMIPSGQVPDAMQKILRLLRLMPSRTTKEETGTM